MTLSGLRRRLHEFVRLLRQLICLLKRILFGHVRLFEIALVLAHFVGKPLFGLTHLLLGVRSLKIVFSDVFDRLTLLL